MSTITIQLDGRGSRQYYPGETLAGSYRFDSLRCDDIAAVEVSVLWHTEGKGNEDIGVHAFWRFATNEGDWIDPRRPGRFATTLPRTPLSYNGAIVKIHWSVRVRVFLENGSEYCDELSFRLGKIPDVRALR